jgi:hypothetical protein
MVRQALRARHQDESLRLVYPAGKISSEQSSDTKTIIVTLATPDEVEVSFGFTRQQMTDDGVRCCRRACRARRSRYPYADFELGHAPCKTSPTAQNTRSSLITENQGQRIQAALPPLREDKMREMTGGCLCGQVRYSANADPAFVGVCHCKNCQKQTGTAFSILVGIPKPAMSIQGRVKAFHNTGDGQPVERNFCPECGSPIFADVTVMPAAA